VKLTPEEESMLDGRHGDATRSALQFQLSVGEFFKAEDFVPIRTAHLASDPESLRDAGAAYLEEMVSKDARFRVPTTTNAGTVDFAKSDLIGQREVWPRRARRILDSLDSMGAHLCNTCVNYQTIDQPLFGEHLAWGDTGTVIWANSVGGARSNFEAGPAALAAGLTGRVPRYGYHLPQQRLATVRVHVDAKLHGRAAWGALGCLIGRELNDYWTVPCIVGEALRPSPDELKSFGASLASYGSVAMFHMVGVTPEARTEAEAFGGIEPARDLSFTSDEIEKLYREFVPESDHADLVVFTAPQLSIMEIGELSRLFVGKSLHPDTRTLITTSSISAAESRRLGYSNTLESTGVIILEGVCFYVMAPHELAEDFGYRTLVTDSAKLANIIAGYGYNPVFRPTSVCVEAAITGQIPW
jgi:predicted aconitase